ncbi:ammonium transporter [Phycisphaerales bacterium AB-hyl4]|uniref:Ammonium transporter n=1 Tax=Natronomicrosphaera hydrolytica TaxID=3242702 RepID=A0ABV4U3S2_9BACT
MSSEMFTVNNLWIMLAGCMVFMMHLGFASLESGLTRAKNTVNILFKNTMIICIGILSYCVIGFSLMYPDAWGLDGILGWAGIGLDPGADGQTSAYDDGFTYYTDFFFQAMFAATAATIVSGAVAERIKLLPFLVYITLIVSISYPITGSWVWGGGWLDEMGFIDFAGSTLVHSVGGWAALAAVIVLGPRLGKYAKDGTVNPIPGHSLPLACIGVFLLWFGWFGFNGGSVLTADADEVSLVLTTTALSAAAGGIAAALVAFFVTKSADLTMALNGILGGLVAITASADLQSPLTAIAIGLIGGGIVVFSVLAFDRIRIDDPVGAISVHGIVGIWGTLAPGIFGAEAGVGQLGTQAVGILAIGAFTLVFAFIAAFAVKALMGFRVDASEEIEGLDLGEHEMSAYPDFQRVYIKSYHAREI